jgi:hypothetical protein
MPRQRTGNDRFQGKKTTDAQRGRPIQARPREEPAAAVPMLEIRERASAMARKVQGGHRHGTR